LRPGSAAPAREGQEAKRGAEAAAREARRMNSRRD